MLAARASGHCVSTVIDSAVQSVHMPELARLGRSVLVSTNELQRVCMQLHHDFYLPSWVGRHQDHQGHEQRIRMVASHAEWSAAERTEAASW
jgi:hypothetical protein